MRDFYERFYSLVPSSPTHALFCQRAFGRDLGQHGFADLDQLDALCRKTGLGPVHRALDLGCGDGRIAEYLSDRTGAHVTGLDYVPAAIDAARARTRAKAQRLAFVEGDINALDLPAAAFDIVFSIDTIYFSEHYACTIRQLARVLRPGGQMGILFSHGWEPWMAPGQFHPETLLPDRTPLARALQANGLRYDVQDWTAVDYRLARLRRGILASLQEQLEIEGLGFVYENRMAEARGICQACEWGLHRRYLYHVVS